MTAPIDRGQITGLVLAGGRGSRMGGVDKGLQPWQGQPLAAHALQRLAPQVGPLAINANRNAEAYQALGAPVWPDTLPDQPGPLAGFAAGLARCSTPWLVTVPCDSPLFPLDLVAKLAVAAQREGARVALAVTLEDGRLQPQPVFCLLHAGLAGSLQAFLQGGQRKIDRWTEQERAVTVTFEDPGAFANVNTLDELRSLRG